MSSSTILFVLKRMLEGPGTGNVFAAAFGPGLTLESALLRKLDERSP
jgi:predicted naringenin-chalcone synthase